MLTKDTNETYGETLVRLGERRPNLVVVEADLTKASGSLPFKLAYGNRFYNVGIAEQDLVSFAAGLSAVDKIPFASTFACFAAQRACDQAMNSVAYNAYNVKIVGTYAGLTSEKNGGTHISVADLAIFRAMPNFTVIDPGDAIEFAQVLETAADNKGPVYIRSNKGVFPVFHNENYSFRLDKAEVLRDGSDVCLITTGITTYEGILAGKAAAEKGIQVHHIHVPVVKPIDVKAVVAGAEIAGGHVITVENHSVIGGLGGAVTEALSAHFPSRVTRLGLQDCFGETADLPYMMHKHGINAKGILEKIITSIKL